MSAPQAPVVHLELHTNDLPSARDLYGELCGWAPDRVDTGHGSYLALDLGRRLGGGIVESSTPHRRCGCPTSRSATYRRPRLVRVALGATLLLAPREGPAGWRSWSPRPSAASSRSGSRSARPSPARGGACGAGRAGAGCRASACRRAGSPTRLTASWPAEPTAVSQSPSAAAMPMFAAAGIVVTLISTPISAPDFAVLEAEHARRARAERRR